MNYASEAAKELWNGTLVFLGIIVGLALDALLAPVIDIRFKLNEETAIPLTHILLAVAAAVYGSVFIRRLRKKKREIHFGNPYKYADGTYYYLNKDLPTIDELFAKVKQEIGIMQTSSTFLTTEKDRDFEKLTEHKLTMLLLHPNSPHYDTHYQFTKSPDLRQKTRDRLKELYTRKQQITRKDNLDIRTYDSYLQYSIISVDPKDDSNAFVQTREYSYKDMEQWEAKIIFKKNNPKEYARIFAEYEEALTNSKPYVHSS